MSKPAMQFPVPISSGAAARASKSELTYSMALLEETTLLDAIEAFYGDDIRSVVDDLCRRARTDPGRGSDLLRVDDLRNVMHETWVQPLAAREEAGDALLPPLQMGEVRLPVAPSPSDVLGGFMRLSSGAYAIRPGPIWDPEVLICSVRRSLLYAHSLVLDDHLAEHFLYRPSVLETIAWLECLAAVKPLVEARVLYLLPCPNVTAYPLVGVSGGITVFGGFDGDAERQLMREKLEDQLPAINDSWAATQAGRFKICSGEVTLDAPSDWLFNLILKKLDGDGSKSRDPDVVRLASLELPSLDSLDMRDFVGIRDDDRFAEFRARLRRALASADGLDDAHAVVAEELIAARNELERTMSRGVLSKHIVPRVTNWAVGAVLGSSLAGWQGALGGIAATAAIEARRSVPAPADAALLKHYVVVSDAAAQRSSPSASTPT